MTHTPRPVFHLVRSPRAGEAERPIGQLGRILADADARLLTGLSARRDTATPVAADRQLPLALGGASDRRPGNLVRAMRPGHLMPVPVRVPGLERDGGST